MFVFVVVSRVGFFRKFFVTHWYHHYYFAAGFFFLFLFYNSPGNLRRSMDIPEVVVRYSVRCSVCVVLPDLSRPSMTINAPRAMIYAEGLYAEIY